MDEQLEALSIPEGPWVLVVPDKLTNATVEMVFDWCAEHGVQRPLVVGGSTIEILDEEAMREHGWVRRERLDKIHLAYIEATNPGIDMAQVERELRHN